MKKTKILSLVSLGAFLLTTSGCTDYDFDSKYEDPSKVTQVTISNLMVGVFQKVKDYDVYEYNRFFGFDSQFTGKYAQTFGYSNTTDMYTPGYIPAIDGQWDNVYSALAQFRKLESLYEEESAAEQAQDEAFYLAAKVQLYDFFAATVDVFGDMPFSEACTLPLTNDVGKSYAHYDKAEDIYKTILDELKEIAPRFRSIPTPRNFNTQDFINNGDMDKWERYANSLRLRLAMRVAAQGDLQAEGRTAIKEILENPSYALAVSEENASGGKIVTAPTCGSCGVMPAVLYHLQKSRDFSDMRILRALATAGLIGNIVKFNASISGAEVGCQGEVGVACAMASAAANQLFGGSPAQIEYAAEMGLEHHLGMTCDPVCGLVQIPCIERNAYAAARALDANLYSAFTDGMHRVSFDKVVQVMKQTGHDLPSLYKETSEGGLAKDYQQM